MPTCQLVIGRLVAHPCGRRTNALCAGCGRPTCDKHLRGPAPPRCHACLGLLAPSTAPLSITEHEMMAFDERDLAAFDQAAGAGLGHPSYDDS